MGHTGYTLSNVTQYHTLYNSSTKSNNNFAMRFSYPQISNSNLPRTPSNFLIQYNNPSIPSSNSQTPQPPMSNNNFQTQYANPQMYHAPMYNIVFPQMPDSNP